VHGLEQEWSGRVNFVYLEIDDPRTDSFRRQYGYRVQPHLLLLDGNGTVIRQWLGFVDREELQAALETVGR
jgi:thioredoxin-related protein